MGNEQAPLGLTLWWFQIFELSNLPRAWQSHGALYWAHGNSGEGDALVFLSTQTNEFYKILWVWMHSEDLFLKVKSAFCGFSMAPSYPFTIQGLRHVAEELSREMIRRGGSSLPVCSVQHLLGPCPSWAGVSWGILYSSSTLEQSLESSGGFSTLAAKIALRSSVNYEQFKLNHWPLLSALLKGVN